MKMEELNKNQMVLLTLFISFVTSIATGIITVSLLQEAPLEVTRNINRIVERTVEKVTPGEVQTQKEVTTVIVKEEDAIIDAVNKNISGMVRIQEKDPASVKTFYGMGIIVSKDGFILSDRKNLPTGSTYIGTFSDGTELQLSPTGVDKKTDFILFKAIIPTGSKHTFNPVTLSEADLKLGQTVVAVGGDTTNAVSVGRVLSLNTSSIAVGTTTAKYITGIETDASSKDIVSGSPLIGLSGAIVGVKLTSESSKLFTPTAQMKKEINILIEEEKQKP